jgi:hypothetical protein
MKTSSQENEKINHALIMIKETLATDSFSGLSGVLTFLMSCFSLRLSLASFLGLAAIGIRAQESVRTTAEPSNDNTGWANTFVTTK